MNKRCLFVLSIVSLITLSGCRGSRGKTTPTNNNDVSSSNGGVVSSSGEVSTNSNSGFSTSVNATSSTSGNSVNSVSSNGSSVTGTLSTLISITSSLTPTTAPSVGNYYDSISSSATGTTLKSALYNLIKGHTKYGYDNLEIAMRTVDRNWDKSPDPSDVNPYMFLLYMVNNDTKAHVWKESYGGFGSTVEGKYCWDKEHMWPKSNGFDTKSLAAYSDLHHLRASDKINNNSARGSLPYGPNTTGGKYYNDYNGDQSGYASSTYLPIARDRGDCARAIFYMATRYSVKVNGDTNVALNLTNGSDSSNGTWGYLSTLLQWNDDDPPDAWEINRNNLVYGIQGNRNPFIDHPEYARRIWG